MIRLRQMALNCRIPFAFLFWLAVAPSQAQSPSGNFGDNIKAAYIFNFIQFVEWPLRAFKSETDPIIVGVFPGSTMAGFLSEIVEGEFIDGHRIVVRNLSQAEEAAACHVVVIPRREESKTREILSALRGTPTLTIGDSETFAERGGAISFFVAQNKLRFAVNPSVIKTHDLKVSSRLLRLATIIDSEPKED